MDANPPNRRGTDETRPEPPDIHAPAEPCRPLAVTGLRKLISLFLLILAVQLGTALALHGAQALSVQTLLAAAIVAALVAAVWDFVVHRPARHGLRMLEARMQSLTQRAAPAAAAVPQPHTITDPLALDRMLAARQRKIAAYTRRLRSELGRYQAIYRQSHDAVMVFNPHSMAMVDCNPRALDLLGRSRDEKQKLRLADLHEEDESQLRDLVDDVMDSPRGRSFRINYRAADGHLVPAEVSASRILHEDGNLLLCITRDISERENAARKIQHLAYHDTLTNLPNRTLLSDRVNRALVRARRTGQIGALLFLDLDRFKRINDSLGHSVGDALLKELANRLRATLREEDTVARLGGDEFVVLLEGLGTEGDVAVDKAREIAAKVRAAFNDEFHLEGHELFVTSSIGVVTFPRDGDSVETLLRHADTAMYHAKGAGRDGARVFETHMDEAAMSRLRLEHELRIALRERQFELFLQPVLGIRDGRALGAEILVRWHHPDKGTVSPSEFMPYIENSSLMLKLDDWVLEESCRLLGEIQNDARLHTPDTIAVNVSQQQFHQPEFVQRVARILEQTGADARRLQFDITETVLLKDAAESITRINALKKLGIRFAIDNFGTGYSSLADLRQLPIDAIKIDRAFIRDIADDPNDAAIVRAILSVAEHIGVTVIAKGIETREQLTFLREAGCQYYQGFLGRPPLDADSFREELLFGADLYHTAAGGPKVKLEHRVQSPAA